jgi:chaperonin GroES
MTVNITPLHDRVLVRRLEEKETAKGGIIIPDTAKEKPQEGEVMAVGAGKIEKGQRIPLDVKVGDRILFGKYTGNDITIDNQEYLILREEEIRRRSAELPKRRPAKSSFADPERVWTGLKFAFDPEGEIQWQNKL